jgi:hypothetical protein
MTIVACFVLWRKISRRDFWTFATISANNRHRLRSFDYAIGKSQNLIGDFEAEKLGGPEVDHEL